MRTPSPLLAFAAMSLLGVLAIAAVSQTPTLKKSPQDTPDAGSPYRFSGPYRHQNLSIFLIHGADQFKGKKFLTAAEALERKQLIIHETQAVSDLQMENLSTEPIIILAGDIYKGGQQDRVARYDLLLPPKSGKVSLPVFCVEHTAPRWMRDLKESDKTFTANFDVLASKNLRLANNYKRSQQEVWKEVSGLQGQLRSQLRAPVQAEESDSSLQLTLKAKAVQEAVEKYIAKLQPILKGKKDVIGYAFAINGQIYAVDMYGSPVLFQKVWPRQVRACAIEAVAEYDKDKKIPAVAVADVQQFLAAADKGETTTQEIQGLRRHVSDAKDNVRFETIAPQEKMMLRKQYLAK